MPKPGATGIQRIIDATGYSMAGLRAAFKHESAFRQELALLIVLLPFAIWLSNTIVDAILLIGSLLLVIIVELMNSAIEAVVDLASEDIHKLAGRAKDIGSAAVMVSLLNVFMVWGLYLYRLIA